VDRPVDRSTVGDAPITPVRDRRMALRLEADLNAAAPARAALADALTGEGWDAERAFDVLLAASEALANAVVHGSEPGACVEVELAVTRQRAWLRVADHGRADARCPSTPPRAPKASATCGRGLLIMGALAERMRIATTGRGTEVVMEFARAA